MTLGHGPPTRAGRGQGWIASNVRQPEIKDFHALLGNQNIAGFQVAMHDPLAMSRIQGVQDLACVLYSFLGSERPLHRSSFHELQYQIIGAHVVQRANVWMVQRGNRPCLSFEAVAELSLRDPNRDDAPKSPIVGSKALAHSSRTQGPFNTITAYLGTCAKLRQRAVTGRVHQAVVQILWIHCTTVPWFAAGPLRIGFDRCSFPG